MVHFKVQLIQSNQFFFKKNKVSKFVTGEDIEDILTQFEDEENQI